MAESGHKSLLQSDALYQVNLKENVHYFINQVNFIYLFNVLKNNTVYSGDKRVSERARGDEGAQRNYCKAPNVC